MHQNGVCLTVGVDLADLTDEVDEYIHTAGHSMIWPGSEVELKDLNGTRICRHLRIECGKLATINVMIVNAHIIGELHFSESVVCKGCDGGEGDREVRGWLKTTLH